jgi:hypothetical protein
MHRPLRETMQDMWQTLAFEPSIASIADDTVRVRNSNRAVSSIFSRFGDDAISVYNGNENISIVLKPHRPLRETIGDV